MDKAEVFLETYYGEIQMLGGKKRYQREGEVRNRALH
jgi:hypothetical protein